MAKESSDLFPYKRLKELEPFFDEVFTSFYYDCLKHEHLARFFTSEEQIKNLIKKQRKNILESFDDTDEDFYKRYIKLTDLHAKTIGLTFVDYIEAIEFLKKQFLNILHREGKLPEYFMVINDYFENVRNYSAKGYLKEFIKDILEHPEPKKQDLIPLPSISEHLKSISQFIESGGIYPIKETIPDALYLHVWFSSLEAKMMLQDTDILERLKKRYNEINALYKNMVHYTREKLYFQSYVELKTLLHNYYAFSKDINEISGSFMQNKQERFLDLIKKIEGNVIIYFVLIENLHLLASLYGQGFNKFIITRLKRNMEHAFGVDNCLSIANDKIIGLVKYTNHGRIDHTLKNIETIIKDRSGKNINTRVIFLDMKDFFTKESGLLGELGAKIFRNIYSFIIDEAKGKEVCWVAEDEINERVKDIIRLEAQKDKYSKLVFEDNRLEIFFQPVFGLRNKKIYDVEALVRLREDGKYVSAYIFMDALYEKNLISELDLKILAKIMEYGSKIKNITNRIFINLSPLSLKTPKYRESIEKTIAHLKGEGITPYFEITEQAILDDIEIIKYISLRHGIKFAIDDFGTGYSSLRTIAELAEADAISHLKIDGSLTKNLLGSEHTYKIIKSTSQMAKSLGLKTVAEFVENERELNTLVELEIDCGQGFYFSPALHIDELVKKYKQGS